MRKTCARKFRECSYFSKKYSSTSGTAAQVFQDIPSVKGLPFIGTKLDLWLAGPKKLHEYIDKRHREFGSIYQEQLGPVKGTFLADPEAFRTVFAQEGKYPVHIIPQPWAIFNENFNTSRGLLFMNGPEWLHHRKILNKIFLKNDLDWLKNCDIIIETFTENLNSEIHDLEGALYKTFLEVLTCCLIGTENYLKRKIKVEPLMKNLTQTACSVFETTSKLHMSMLPLETVFKYNFPQWTSFETSMRNALNNANDLVDFLISENCDGLLGKMLNENLELDKIKAIVADLILAASDTTAYTMQWILYSICKNVEVQEKLREETSPNSKYIRYVLKETLRLYPVAPFLTRFLPNECHLLDYRVPANSLIIMSIYSTGRSEKYFKDPLKFQPERWERNSGNSDLQQAAATLPFAIGARSCIGRKLAEYELQKMLLEILKKFQVSLLNETEIRMVLKMVAVPSEPLRIKLKKL